LLLCFPVAVQDQPLFIFPSGAKALLLGELRPVVP
jgi:hypothetical protein